MHNECASGVCQSDGSCAPQSAIFYVDIANPSCASANGLMATPYCQITTAITTESLAPRPFIVVKGNDTSYNSVSIAPSNDFSVTIIGPGRSGNPPATVQGGPSTNGFDLSVSAHVVAVVIDGFWVHSANDGIRCTKTGGTASLDVRNTAMTLASGHGLYSSNCDLTMDGDWVAGNTAGGVYVLGNYSITNTFIFNNGSSASNDPGVYIVSPSSGVFAFNTVAGNIKTGLPGGISTGSAMTVTASIVTGNSMGSNTQFSGTITLDQVVVGSTDVISGTGAIRLDPDFVAAGDRHLMDDAANATCCIDKVSAPTTPNHDHDADFTPRPKGLGWDIGAHELK
jgi:hypothetical protein